MLSVWAPPSQLLPATNKRNAALLQRDMELAIGVGAARGVVRFVGVREEDVAWGGCGGGRVLSVMALRPAMSGYNTATTIPELTPPGSVDGGWSSLESHSGTSEGVESRGDYAPPREVALRKKSLVAAIFGR